MPSFKSFSVGLCLILGAPFAKAAVQGFDISHYQSSVDFQAAYSSGARFAIIKATEGTTFLDPAFTVHYQAGKAAGLICGSYHFARPASSTGSAQAKYFISNGGRWSKDGSTLPGMVDLEFNPSGDSCYGLSTTSMVAWISDFVNTYQASEGRYPLLYTSTSWWNRCTGSSEAFGATCPLVVARYSSSVGALPAGWLTYTIWQNSGSYIYGGDSDLFNGSEAQLQSLASS
ncbi:putative N,O-diacetyl muramidase [Thelonectria olida]|uniref:N,O-diacetylmuramidase n=1 Tax=Thelonectria olida TaxID=1576542 RepID=A0A9P8VYD2_9HYPO|nr:putative N,O-diacetyl muramidase [Thelonectria olida]